MYYKKNAALSGCGCKGGMGDVASDAGSVIGGVVTAYGQSQQQQGAAAALAQQYQAQAAMQAQSSSTPLIIMGLVGAGALVFLMRRR